MKGLLQILFKNYNDFYIPYQDVNGKKTLILNSLHAFYTNDAKYYDECLKITYSFDDNKFTVRTQNEIRRELNMPQLESFLLNEIKKYELPKTEVLDSLNNFKACVTQYFFPETKEVNSNIKLLNKMVEKDKEILMKFGVYEMALLIIQKKINYEINSIKSSVNLSEVSRFKMTGSIVEELGKFLTNKNVNSCILHETDGKYWVDISLTKL